MSGDWGYGTALKIFLWGYLIGGVTLLPAVLVLAWFWGTTAADHDSHEGVTLEGGEASERRGRFDGSTNGIDEDSANLGLGLDDETLEKLKGRTHVPDVFAGYFAVCREYVPGGINGKPPDRTTPAGAVVSMESPSVYQSMYRSIFDRNKSMSPTIEASNARSKKARNVFYVVLRLGHLMLYDNEDQLEVRHVISLAHYKADVYAGGERIPEGELWIKRNCIRLIQKLASDIAEEAKTFYLFSDNCSEKEDFYHAMLQAQEHHKDHATGNAPPIPLKFETPDLVKLVQQLHASEENLHTRWINALIGRVFLALYKTSQVKDLIATKINKKIARVPKPALISSVQLRSVDMGTLPPFITNPKLKELTVDGDLVVEADVSYKGNIRIEISATARIDLGTRFKAREVTLILATVLRKLDGHILIRIKPPPSNRLWITFETPPRMELSLEPIVSSRQITYGVVLRAIESRIREVVNETLVLPNWDDMPFTDTIAQIIRGGIWEDDQKGQLENLLKLKQDDAAIETAIADTERLNKNADASSHLYIPSSFESDDVGTGISSSTDYKPSAARPRPLRSASSATPVSAPAELVNDREFRTPKSIRSLPITSPMRSPLQPSIADITTGSSSSSGEDVTTASVSEASTKSAPLLDTEKGHNRVRSKDLTTQEIAAAAAAAAGATNMTKKQTLNQSLNTATTAARNWLASKQNPQSSRTNNPIGSKNSLINNRPRSSEGNVLDGDGTAESTQHAPVPKSHTEPMGRGQPLPPLGQPLPPPAKPEKRQTWALPAASTFANLAKRKHPSATPAVSERRSKEQLTPPTDTIQAIDTTQDSEEIFRKKSSATQDNITMPRRKSSAASSTHSPPPPPLPKRRQRQPSLNLSSHHRRASQNHTYRDEAGDDVGEGLLVVAAPLVEGSAPNSPVDGEGKAGSSKGDGDSGEVSLASEKASERGVK
ncbi:Nn.00g036820.m01.CDS01 [Neocucurbitaria sp. VM-36]